MWRSSVVFSHNPRERGFNLYAHVSARLGLGQAARNTADLMSAGGIPFAAFDVEPPLVVPVEEDIRRFHLASSPRSAYAGVNLFHLNPIEALGVMAWSRAAGIDLCTHLNVVVPFWEFPTMPPEWAPVLRGMDVVLAPSAFVGDAVTALVPSATVMRLPVTVNVPRDVKPDRSAWGFTPETVVFLVSFDVLSDLSRKNPWGAIAAFQAAFPADDGVRLVVKVNNAETGAASDEMARLREAAADDARITLVDRSLPFSELWSLYASVDVFVSLHRSEGLGLPALEFMSLGKPVVATGWSGTADHVTSSTGMPVSYRLVPVEGLSIGSYRSVGSAGDQWAEPDIDDAAEKLRALRSNPELRADLGTRARAAVEQLRKRSSESAVFDDLLARASTVRDSPEHRARCRRLRSEARRLRARLEIVGMLRAVGLRPPVPAGQRLPGSPRYYPR